MIANTAKTTKTTSTAKPRRESAMPAPMNRQERADRRKAIARAIRSGRTVSDVAKEFSVSRSTILNSCVEHGVVVAREQGRQKQDSKPGDQFLQILAMLIQGCSVAEISEKISVTKQYVNLVKQRSSGAGIFKAVKSLGKSIPEWQDPTRVTDEQKMRTLRFLLEGRCTYEEIGEKVGLHKATVSDIAQVAKKAGLMKFASIDRTRSR